LHAAGCNGLRQVFRQSVEPCLVVALEFQQLSDSIVPAARSARTIGRPAVAQCGRSNVTCSPEIEGGSAGIDSSGRYGIVRTFCITPYAHKRRGRIASALLSDSTLFVLPDGKRLYRESWRKIFQRNRQCTRSRTWLRTTGKRYGVLATVYQLIACDKGIAFLDF
jgi:hypothetical protein